MSNGPQDVRLVKCPRCTKILPEPTDVPLYTCGGCGTILQARYYRTRDERTRLGLHELGSLHSNGEVHHDGGRDPAGLNQRSSPRDQHSSEHNEETHWNDVGTLNQEQPDNPNSSHGVSLTEEPASVLGENSSQLPPSNGEIDNTINEQGKSDSTAMETSNHEEVGIASSRNDSVLSEHPTFFEHGNSLQLHVANGELVEELDQNQEKDHIALENSNQKRDGAANFVGEASSSNASNLFENNEPLQSTNGAADGRMAQNVSCEIEEEHIEGLVSRETVAPTENHCRIEETLENTEADKEVDDELYQSELVDCKGEQPGLHPSVATVFPTETTHNVNEKPALLAEADTKADEIDNASAFPNVKETSGETTPIGNGEQTNSESCSSDNKAETSNIDESYNGAADDSEGVRAENANAETVEPANFNLEVRATAEEVSRSPATMLFAYDGSVSSLDGHDDQILDHHSNLPQNAAEYIGTEEQSDRDGHLASNMTLNSPGIRLQDDRPNLQKEKLNSSTLNKNESREGTSTPKTSRRKSKNQQFPPRAPLYPRNSSINYETGSSSSYVHDGFQSHQMHRPPYGYESHGSIRSRHNPDGFVGRRVLPDAAWNGKEHLSIYSDYEVSGEIYQNPRYPRHIERRRHLETCSQCCSLKLVPYSEELLNHRYHVHDPYFHRYPDETRWSEQLPSRYMAHSRQMSWDLYDSCPRSPPRFRDYESYPTWAHDSLYLSDEPRHKDRILRRSRFREKRQSVTRHFRPIAGGAPFVSCYFCLTLLQLPADFILFERKSHLLKCFACSRILKFSLENGRNLVPCMSNATAGTGEAAESRTSLGEAQVPDSDCKEMASRGSFEATNGQASKFSPKDSQNEERTVNSQDEQGPPVQSKQMKVTWELPAGSKSPLHRLLGYSSASDLLNASDSIRFQE